jgi:hypothetical protein
MFRRRKKNQRPPRRDEDELQRVYWRTLRDVRPLVERRPNRKAA